MDFLGGALPNVMFIVGMLAIGLGLGIELKLVPLNKEIDKTGRIGAIVVGAILVVASLYIYLNSSTANRSQPTPGAMSVAQDGAAAAPTVASLPTEAPVPSAAATALPPPSSTALPVAPAAPTPPPTQVAEVKVPDLHGLSEDEAQAALKKLGLQPRKVEQCTSSDQGDPKTKKHRIQCQNLAANKVVPLGTVVEYVVR